MPSHVGDVQSSLLHVPPGMINDAAEEDVAYLHVNICQLLDRVGLSRQSPSSRAKRSDDGQLPWWHDLQDPAGVNRINFQICVVNCSYV